MRGAVLPMRARYLRGSPPWATTTSGPMRRRAERSRQQDRLALEEGEDLMAVPSVVEEVAQVPGVHLSSPGDVDRQDVEDQPPAGSGRSAAIARSVIGLQLANLTGETGVLALGPQGSGPQP